MSRGMQRVAVLAVILVAAALANYLFGIDILGEDQGSANRAAMNSPGKAGQALQDLDVSPPGSMAGYEREDFPHWSGADEFGWRVSESSCDVRDAALIRDGQDVSVGEDCDVESGRWLDPYTGQTFTDPSDIDIDHVVPLANAYRSGASAWDETQRERYANAPEVVLSVEDNANQEKGDKGPEAWKPPDQAVWCDYAGRWISIKSDYDLGVNQQEKTALSEMLATCKSG